MYVILKEKNKSTRIIARYKNEMGMVQEEEIEKNETIETILKILKGDDIPVFWQKEGEYHTNMASLKKIKKIVGEE